jgi:hypothetical protein
MVRADRVIKGTRTVAIDEPNASGANQEDLPANIGSNRVKKASAWPKSAGFRLALRSTPLSVALTY